MTRAPIARPSRRIVDRLTGRQVFAILQAAVLICGTMFFLQIRQFETFGVFEALVAGTAVAVLVALYFGWMLAVAITMNSLLPRGRQRRQMPAVVGLVFAVVYAPVFFQAMLVEPMPVALATALWVAHVGALLANLHILGLCSATLVAAERGAGSHHLRTAAVFLLLWLTALVPVGAWWVHDRARRLLGAAEEVGRASCSGSRSDETA
ncbi:MAG: hypothetical protein DWQ36_13790 [Acidobacteria bacterium]|nr:MAG: hypothetical protein DWQ30_20165 [Acidobacteriota bacterium]REK06280.1 MAG: hypothetical protein DWQ36_13790 [Acidobacteriota bacterium]